MVTADLLRAVLLGTMALVVVADGSPVVVYAISIVGTVIGTAFRPAQAALVPGLAKTPEELTAANVASSTIESVGIFVGPALGGLLVATAGVEATFAASAALFVWSAALIGAVDEPAKRVDTDDDEAEEAAGFLRETSEGFRAIVADRRLTVLTGLFAAQTFVDGALGVLVVVLALETLDLGASGVGYLNSVSGWAGSSAGSPPRRSSRGLGSERTSASGSCCGGCRSSSSGSGPSRSSRSSRSRSSVSATRSSDVSGDTLLQRAVPDEVLARVFAAWRA